MTITATATTTPAGETVSGRFAFTLPVTPGDLRKPAYAYVGLADLALEQVKDLPALYVGEVKKVSARLAEAPQAVRTLPTRVEELVSTAYDKASEQAGDLYAQLAVRGERLVTSIRRQPATEAAIVEGKEAVREAEAAVVAARSSARAGGKAVAGAAEKIG